MTVIKTKYIAIKTKLSNISVGLFLFALLSIQYREISGYAVLKLCLQNALSRFKVN